MPFWVPCSVAGALHFRPETFISVQQLHLVHQAMHARGVSRHRCQMHTSGLKIELLMPFTTNQAVASALNP